MNKSATSKMPLAKSETQPMQHKPFDLSGELNSGARQVPIAGEIEASAQPIVLELLKQNPSQ
jgi:hypothetical protein